MSNTKLLGHPASWVPSLYLAEALPNTAAVIITVIMFQDMGLSNAQATFYAGWLGLPWIIKPIWSSIVDNMQTKRWWILAMQYLVGCSLALVAFALHTDFWLQMLLAIFMLVAFASATHDISADGFYILTLNEQQQSAFLGIRNTFYRIGMLIGQGGLVALAGLLINGQWGLPKLSVPTSWAVVYMVIVAIMLLLAVYHSYALPKIEKKDSSKLSIKEQFSELGKTLKLFISKPYLYTSLAFILLFRLPEGLLSNVIKLFMKDSLENGGLGLDNAQLGFVTGTLGVVGLLAGGIVGGFLVARYGLKRCLWPLVLCFTLPDIVYLLLSMYPTASLAVISTCVAVEQFGYGLGFAAYTLFLIQFSRGERATAVFSLCTALQYLGGIMLPGMISGLLSEHFGYTTFFVIVMVTCLVTFAVTAMAHINEHEDAPKKG